MNDQLLKHIVPESKSVDEIKEIRDSLPKHLAIFMKASVRVMSEIESLRWGAISEQEFIERIQQHYSLVDSDLFEPLKNLYKACYDEGYWPADWEQMSAAKKALKNAGAEFIKGAHDEDLDILKQL